MKLRRTELKKARIEIIPMIDAIFFLLVFFMMTSLSMVQLDSHKVNLPQSSTALQKPMDKVVVSIAKEGTLFVGQNQVHEAELLGELTRRVRENPNITVIMNCDRDQQVSNFVRIFDLIKQSNAGKVMIATAPKQPGEMAGDTVPAGGVK